MAQGQKSCFHGIVRPAEEAEMRSTAEPPLAAAGGGGIIGGEEGGGGKLVRYGYAGVRYGCLRQGFSSLGSSDAIINYH